MAALPPYASTGQRLWYWGFRAICVAILAYLILPILVIIPLSFNATDFFTFTPGILTIKALGTTTTCTPSNNPGPALTLDVTAAGGGSSGGTGQSGGAAADSGSSSGGSSLPQTGPDDSAIALGTLGGTVAATDTSAPVVAAPTAGGSSSGSTAQAGTSGGTAAGSARPAGGRTTTVVTVVDGRRVRTTVLCTLRDPQMAELLGLARKLISANLRQGQVLLAALDDADDALSARGAATVTA